MKRFLLYLSFYDCCIWRNVFSIIRCSVPKYFSVNYTNKKLFQQLLTIRCYLVISARNQDIQTNYVPLANVNRILSWMRYYNGGGAFDLKFDVKFDSTFQYVQFTFALVISNNRNNCTVQKSTLNVYWACILNSPALE